MRKKLGTPDDAVRVSVNQNGKVDIPYIARLLNRSNEDVTKEIVDTRIGFINPETGLVDSRNQYLSGNVRDKLSIAQQANQSNEYDTNIEELSKIIPTDIPMNLIKLTLGSTWVPTNIYNDFFKETFNVDADISKTSTDKYIGKLSGKNNAKDLQMGMPKVGGSTLALNAMNNTSTTITMVDYRDGKRVLVTDPIASAQAGAKQTELEETFEAWVKQNKKYHDELENIYNNTFNAVVNSTIDVESFDRFPGAGGRVVRIQSNLKTAEGGDVLQFRVAKENTEVDNEKVQALAKKLNLSYDKKADLFSTDSGMKAAQFEKEANGTSKILRQHQKEGVVRGLEGATLLAHEVGTGKTLTLITTAMEMRRLGLAKKPTIIVQRSTYKQFVKEIKNQYPNAKVLAPSAKDLTAKQREQLFAKIAYNDWDIVVLYHSYLDSIPDDPQRVAQYIDEKIQEKMDLLSEMERAKDEGGANAGRMIGALKKEIEKLERDRESTLNPSSEEETPTKSKRKRSVKDVEKVRSNAEAKAAKSLDRRTDNTLGFEQLGIDALLIDEAHAYKKLGFVTSLQRVKGIDTAESKRAQSTRLKTSYILENHNGKNVVFATGTPISNTMAEMWTFMRFLYPNSEMSRLQMNNFDAFVNNFGSIEESAEFGTNGKFRVTNRFSYYSNVPELIAAWRQVAHTVLTEEVSTLREGVGTPRLEGGMPTDIMIEQTTPLKSVMKAIKNKLEAFDKMTGAEKKENSHIPLVMFGLAKRAAIDVRLVDPNLPDHPQSKLNITVDEVVKDLKETKSYKGTIAIFCDSYQSSDKSFNVFRDIKNKLIDRGIPAEQIAVINDYEKDDAKEKLFSSVNAGDIRVVMGTTEKLGVGVNIQERLHLAAHMDAPIRPSDYQQRNGRIARQGNTHLNMDKTIKILRIGVQKTLDVTGYQRLEIKKKFIDQIMKGNVSQRMLEEADIESTDSSNFNQMMANLSGSQAALALSIEQNNLKKLLNARVYHDDNQIYMAGAVKRAKGIIVGNTQTIDKLDKYKKELQKLIPEGKVVTVSIGKVSASTPEEIEALLNKHITKKIEVEVEALRSDFLREKAQLKSSLSVNDIKIDLTTTIQRKYDIDSGKTRVTKEIMYVTPDVNLHSPTFADKENKFPLFEGNAGANIQNMIDQINDLLSGYDIDRLSQKYKLGIDKAQRDIDAYEGQIGQTFPKQKELLTTESRVEELESQMRDELELIEAEEAKEDVDAIDIDDIVNKNSEDEDDDPTPPKGNRRQSSSSGSFVDIPAAKFDKLVDKLNQTGLASEIVVDENIGNNREIQDGEGDVYGYVTPEGVIHMDARRMNANTPIHEFGHLWNSFTKENDTALYNRGVELILESPYMDHVNNDSVYSSLSEEARIDEAIAKAIGDKGEAITNRNIKQQFVDWLADVWSRVKQAFGINTNLSLEDMSLSDFTDRAVQDLLKGERLVDSAIQLDEIRLQSVNSPEFNIEYEGDAEAFIEAQAEALRIEKQYQSKLELAIANGKARRAFVDQFQPLEELQKIVEELKGKRIQEHENAYMMSQMVQSLDGVQMDVWKSDYMNPIYASVRTLESDEVTTEQVYEYMKVKHGVLRNERLRIRNESKDPNADFAGIYPILERYDYQLNDIGAGEFIQDFENSIGIEKRDALWQSIKDATNHILGISYNAGVLSKKSYTELKNRDDFYIPLRGWEETTMAEVNEYMGRSSIKEAFNSVLRTAEGRETEADNPIAFIKMMGESEIMRANKNRMKQALLNMVRNHKADSLYSVDKIYEILDYDPKTRQETWMQVNYRPSDEMFEQGFARQVNTGHSFEHPITLYEVAEHQIIVYEMGEKYVITLTSPAVAQSVNGMLNQSIRDTTWISWASGVNRFMSAAYTKWNPEFFLYTNFARDWGMANMMHLTNYGADYTKRFNKNIPSAMGAYWRAMFGNPDMNNPIDVALKEFIDNGGETGFAVLKDIEKTKQEIERMMQGKKSLYEKFEDSKVLQTLEKMGQITEGTTRFATYLTSKSTGKTVKQSIIDAKNATVNFNKKGSGETIKLSDLNVPILSKLPFFKDMPLSSRFFQIGYVFFNASIQGVDVVYQAGKKNKKAMGVIFASFYAAGAMLSVLGRMLMDWDDEMDMSEYDKIPEWVRRNNLIIPISGKSYITIPLPQIFRSAYGIGEMSASFANGSMKGQNIGLEIIGSMSDDISPVDVGSILSKKGDRWYVSGAIPTMVKPLYEVMENIDYLGRDIAKQNQYNTHLPEHKRVFNRTGKQWILLSELINKATGGDNVQSGWANINPAKMEHLTQNYFGGLLKFTDKSVSRLADVGRIIGGEDIEIDSRDVPLFGRMYGKSSNRVGMSNYSQRYYDYLREAEEFDKRSSEYLKQMDYAGYDKFREENKDKVGPYSMIKAYNKGLQKLKKAGSMMPDKDTKSLATSDLLMIDAVSKYELEKTKK